MPRPEDSGGPAPPRRYGGARMAFGSVQTLGVRTSHVEAVPALQGARSPLRPPGYSVYASPILFTVSPHLRHGRKTRYGWVATPYPTGTFTLQEMPSFSWRDNARRQAPPIAAAQRRLLAVACTPLFGWGAPWGCGSGAPHRLLAPPRSHAYWITSSAKRSRDGGMVIPSALAVFRLMTSSNFMGCSTG